MPRDFVFSLCSVPAMVDVMLRTGGRRDLDNELTLNLNHANARWMNRLPGDPSPRWRADAVRAWMVNRSACLG